MRHKIDRSIMATILVVILLFFISLFEYRHLKEITSENNYRYLDETLNTAASDFEQRLEEDRNVLLTLADLVASYENVDSNETRLLIKRFTPHTISSRIAVLLPDNSLITVSGDVDNSGFSFSEIAQKGAHVGSVDRGRVDGKAMIRNYVPVVKAGQTVAMLYGVIVLEDLPEKWTYSVLEGKGYISILDKTTGEFIYDNLHTSRGNIEDYPELIGLSSRVSNIRKGSDHIYFSELGSDCYVAYQQFNSCDYCMIMVSPKKSAYYQTNKTRNILMYTYCCIAITIGIYLVWLLNYTRKKNKETRAHVHSAEHDKLTKLYNRQKFDQVGKSLENGYHFALILIDVDYFKEVNDEYGHIIGDKVLSRIGDVLSETFGEKEYPCRYGGDEFAVIMPGYTPRQKQEISQVIYKIQKSISESVDGLPTVTLSIGIAFSDAICSMDDVFKMADGALYNVKKNGRDGYEFGTYKEIKLKKSDEQEA